MRIGLLVMLEPVGAGVPMSRAFLRVSGKSVARHQLELALAVECQKIVCLAHGVTGDVIDLQRDAENAGAGFHVVQGARGLIGQVTASDDLIVLSDGVLPDIAEGRRFVEAGHGVAGQAIEEGLALGFERIDLNHATAGIMRIPGRMVERLAELPADCDVVSALTRISLQGGMAIRPITAVSGTGPAWRIIRDDDEAHRAEDAWIAGRLDSWKTPVPGLLLARSGLFAFGPALLHRGHGGRTVMALAMLLLALALGCGWYGFTGFSLVLAGVAWVMVKGAGVLRGIEQSAGSGAHVQLMAETWLLAAVDAVMIVILVWQAPQLPGENRVDRAFAPVMLLGLLRLLPAMLSARGAAWLADRAVLAAVLCLLSALGVLGGGVPLLAICLLLGGIVLARPQSRLTTD